MNTAPADIADRTAIAQAILEILARTAKDHAALGEAGTDLRDASEFLLAVDIAKGLASALRGLRYRLAPPPESAAASRPAAGARGAPDKEQAVFDVVMLDADSGEPRYVVAAKHGTRIIDDVHRVMRAAAAGHGRTSWRHAFLVTLLRRSEAQALRIAEKLAGEIEDPSTRESAGLAANAPIEVTHRLQRIGESRSAGKDGTAIYAAIFGLTLGAANADAAAGATGR